MAINHHKFSLTDPNSIHYTQHLVVDIDKPRCTCAARFTVLGLCVCRSLCVSVCLSVSVRSSTTDIKQAYE